MTSYPPLPICESYNVSPEGIVYNFVGMTIKIRGKKYLSTQLAGRGLEKSRHPVDYLVAITYLEKPKNEGKGFYIINHKDKNIFNNHVDNLEWIPYYLFQTQKYYGINDSDEWVPCGDYYRKNYVFSKPIELY